ncbi:hypothetical protein RCL1_005336 [Eukaryota sp. TZLM3-RCL]
MPEETDQLIINTILEGSSTTVHCSGNFISDRSTKQIAVPRGNKLHLLEPSSEGLVQLASIPLFRNISSIITVPIASFTNDCIAFLSSSHEIGILKVSTENNRIDSHFLASNAVKHNESLGVPLDNPSLIHLTFGSTTVLIAATLSGCLSFVPIIFSPSSSSLPSHTTVIDEISIVSIGQFGSTGNSFFILGDVTGTQTRNRRLCVYTAAYDAEYSTVSLSVSPLGMYTCPDVSSFAQSFSFNQKPAIFVGGVGFVLVISEGIQIREACDCFEVITGVQISPQHFLFFDSRGSLFEMTFTDSINYIREVPVKFVDNIDKLSTLQTTVTSCVALDSTTILAFCPFSDSYLISIKPFVSSSPVDVDPLSYAAVVAPALKTCAPIASLCCSSSSLIGATGIFSGGSLATFNRGGQFIPMVSTEIPSQSICHVLPRSDLEFVHYEQENASLVDPLIVLSTDEGSLPLSVISDGQSIGLVDSDLVTTGLQYWKLEESTIAVGLLGNVVPCHVTPSGVYSSLENLRFVPNFESKISMASFSPDGNQILIGLENSELISLTFSLTSLSFSSHSFSLPSPPSCLSCLDNFSFVSCWDHTTFFFSSTNLSSQLPLPPILSSKTLPRHCLLATLNNTIWLFVGHVDGSIAILNISKLTNSKSTSWIYFSLSTLPPSFSLVPGNEPIVLAVSDRCCLFKPSSSHPIPIHFSSPSCQFASSAVFNSLDISTLTLLSSQSTLHIGSVDNLPSIHCDFHDLNGLTPRRLDRINDSVVVSSADLSLEKGKGYMCKKSTVGVYDPLLNNFENFHEILTPGELPCSIAVSTVDSLSYVFSVFHNESRNFSYVVIHQSTTNQNSRFQLVGSFDIGQGTVYSIISIPNNDLPTVSICINSQVLIYELNYLNESWNFSVLSEFSCNFYSFSQDYFQNFLLVGDRLSSVILLKILRNKDMKIESLKEISRDYRPLNCRSCRLIDSQIAVTAAELAKIQVIFFPFDDSTSTFASRGPSFVAPSPVNCFESASCLYPVYSKSSLIIPSLIAGCVDGSLLLISRIKGSHAVKLRQIAKCMINIFLMKESDYSIIHGDLILFIDNLSECEKKVVAMKVGIDLEEMNNLIKNLRNSI